MALFLLILLIALITAIAGALIDGLWWLIIVAIVIAICDFVLLGAKLRGGRRPAR